MSRRRLVNILDGLKLALNLVLVERVQGELHVLLPVHTDARVLPSDRGRVDLLNRWVII